MITNKIFRFNGQMFFHAKGDDDLANTSIK